MRCSPVLCVFYLFLTAFIAPSLAATEAAAGTHIALGDSVVPLNGPWRFHVGDDPRWSLPTYDDHAWETVDLTPAPGSHDGDVGLPGYVTGWSQRGHAHYTGYAWYRLDVTVENTGGKPLALAGPTLLDSTYELFVNGTRVGGPGDFAGKTPSVYSVRPAVFAMPSSVTAGVQTYHLAFRVWMDPIDAGDESGGIHVAPMLGDTESIERLHQVQWLQTFKGYVVDAAEPVAFVLLAIMLTGLIKGRDHPTHVWLAIALILLALLRVNQVLFYWTPYWSLRSYDIAVTVLLRPLVLASWVLAWRDWFGLTRYPWLRNAVTLLTTVYVVSACLGRPWVTTAHGVVVATDALIAGARITLAALYLWVIGQGVARSMKWPDYVAALAAVLVGIGLFATEVNALGVPGIWFPYGTGVARGQYAYAAFIPLMFALILWRLSRHARRDD